MKVIYKIYSFCIAIPIFIVLTILVAITAAVASILGDDKGLGYHVPKWWGRITCWLFLLPVEVKGREYIDAKQSYVFLANHQSYFDIFLIYGYLGHNFKWMMKEYLKKIPFVGYACVKLKHVYVGDSISSIQKTVTQALETSSLQEIPATIPRSVLIALCSSAGFVKVLYSLPGAGIAIISASFLVFY